MKRKQRSLEGRENKEERRLNNGGYTAESKRIERTIAGATAASTAER
jgi:hypothetical protein